MYSRESADGDCYYTNATRASGGVKKKPILPPVRRRWRPRPGSTMLEGVGGGVGNRVVRPQMPGWLAARRYGVPAAMVAEATGRRRVGDWRGACAAARFDVQVDLAAVRDRYGTQAAAGVEDRLLHFAPDLARWHAPREPRDRAGRLFFRRRVVLARIDDGPVLYLRLPHGGQQRISLICADSAELEDALSIESWTDAPWLFDARETHRLLGWLGGGDRAPFFERNGLLRDEAAQDPVTVTEEVIILQDADELAQAWAAGGVRADFTISSPVPDGGASMPDSPYVALVPTLARLVRMASVETIVLDRSWPAWPVAVTREAGGELHAVRVSLDQARLLPTLPAALWRRPPDLDLLRAGMLAADELHPLVRAALFPDQPDPGYHPRLPEVDGSDVRVRCQHAVHRLGWRAGVLTALDHAPDETQPELDIDVLGDRVPRCHGVVRTWYGQPGRLPEALHSLRADAFAILDHGDCAQFAHLLDAGIGPAGMFDGDGANPLHHLYKLDDWQPLLRRLLDAGLQIDARDVTGRTPFLCAVADFAPVEYLNALVENGADPLAIDAHGRTALHLLWSHDLEAVVPWLIDLGIDPYATDSSGDTAYSETPGRVWLLTRRAVREELARRSMPRLPG